MEQVAGGRWQVRVSSTIVCSDLLLFSIFENGQIAADQVYFYEFISKKSANFAVRACRSFHFHKIKGPKKLIFC